MNEDALLLTLAETVVLALGVIAVLHRRLQRMIGELTIKDSQARFWTQYSEVLLVLIPVLVTMLGCQAEGSTKASLALQVLQFSKWPIIGVIAALLTMAVLIVLVVRPLLASIRVKPYQVTDMERLLDRMERIRARELLRGDETQPGAKAAPDLSQRIVRAG
jgi:hypothetical protein